ncbi:MAG: chromosome segregation protein SMC, partial [Gammaproteobacteria bacterium]|nr:chromosome segregation protein SMC [Gammaproteobacteria bacterium]
FIEAKPEELRMYLEEAAGVSKYKERRRETENRLRHTKENLERLDDVRGEIAKQLEHLNRQAKAAERYKVLKEEERLTKAQLLALHWQDLTNQLANYDKIIKEQDVLIEERVAEQHRLGALIEQQRVQQTELNDEFNAIQGRYYAIGTEIAKLEQNITHHRERFNQLNHDHQQVERQWQELNQHLQDDQQRIAELQHILTRQEPGLVTAQQVAESSSDTLTNAEQTMHDWQSHWDSFNQGASETVQQARVEQTRIQHLETQLADIQKRLQRLTEEQQKIDFAELDSTIAQLSQKNQQLEQTIGEQQAELDTLLQRIAEQRHSNEKYSQDLHAIQQGVQTARGRQASLQALQQAALNQEQDASQNWLSQHQLTEQPRLAQCLQVDEGWETAVETALGDYLEAVCVDSSEQFADDIATLASGQITLVSQHNSSESIAAHTSLPRLSEHVNADYAAHALLTHVYCSKDLTEALTIRPQLKDGESIITQDGIWLGKHWLRISKDNDAKTGTLKREKELTALAKQLANDEQQVTQLQQQLQQGKNSLTQLEQQRETQQRQINQVRDQQHNIKTKWEVKQHYLQRLQQRVEEMRQETTEAKNTQQQHQQTLQQTRMTWQQALEKNEQDETQRQTLSMQRTTLREALDGARQKSRQDKEQTHQLTLQVENARTQLTAIEQASVRMDEQLNSLGERRQQLQQALNENQSPVEDLEQQLKDALQKRINEETALTTARQQVENVNEQLQQHEQQRDDIAQKIESLRSKTEQKRLDFQGFNVRRETYQEQIIELHFELDPLCNGLPEQANVAEWEESVQRIANRIQRLGAINLAAIDEYTVQEERKNYLDTQHADLIEALTTLENAIHKIDNETKTRFKDTFDIVNDGFKELFPQVFGGGNAYLELTDNDLLNTGINVIARPPGKRNTSIHLLSGGEKALTAISLVFAIFRLNPAPFCLLDEVDAPLDDANVGRFCNLVKAMSETVQFMFISHNKLAIEMADHLTGVTMHEPGVSRIVAVDMDEAVQMAAA